VAGEGPGGTALRPPASDPVSVQSAVCRQ
jgi:hypothetical protein